MTDHLDWIEKTTDIPAGGLKRDREATYVELQQIAQALDILKVGNLSSNYRITAIAGGAYRLAGTIAADVEQSCIVSLEPVSGKINAAFDVEFWPTVAPTSRCSSTGLFRLAESSSRRCPPPSIPIRVARAPSSIGRTPRRKKPKVPIRSRPCRNSKIRAELRGARWTPAADTLEAGRLR